MLFNSLKFLFLFLPITMLGFHLLGRYGRRPVIVWLALMSVVFYAAWNTLFVLFLLGSILVNYLISRAIDSAAPTGVEPTPAEATRRKQLLFLGVTLNLLALFYFKYLFKVLLVIKVLHLANINPHPILLPLGISFFTFTQISYLIDLAQGQAERQDFLFVSPLRYLLPAPHRRAHPPSQGMMPQFGKLRPEDAATNLDQALTPVPTRSSLRPQARRRLPRPHLVPHGTGKKSPHRRQARPTADLAFSHAGTLSAASAWTGLIVYSMQLYFDFSGYSDMALGLARIFSIRFPLNFDSPYKATSVTEYWQRWHITLTRYITLYLYNPLLLGVQRHRLATGKKISRKALATFGGFTAMVAYPTLITMLLTGAWHGAGFQFLLFGLIHGIYLTANQAWRHFRPRAHNAPALPPPTGSLRLALMLGVYLQVTFAQIFFRSDSLHAAFALLSDMGGHHGFGHVGSLLDGALAFALFPIVWFFPNTQQILGQEPEPTSPAQAITQPIAPDQLAPPSSTTLLSRLRWSPSLKWAVLMAVVLFAVLANMDSTASFLYFQF